MEINCHYVLLVSWLETYYKSQIILVGKIRPEWIHSTIVSLNSYLNRLTILK